MTNLLNGFHDIVLHCFFHIHDAANVLMFVLTVDSTAKYQLQHSAEFSLVSFLHCHSNRWDELSTDKTDHVNWRCYI